MDELDRFREFRSGVAGPSRDAERRASDRLTDAIERPDHPGARVLRSIRRRPGRAAVAVAILVGASAAALFVSSPWKSSPGFLERAQAALTLPEGRILHAKLQYTRTSKEFGCTVTLSPNELWADLSDPRAYREIHHELPRDGVVDRRTIACTGGSRTETGGTPSGSLRFVPPNTLEYFGPGRTGPSADEVTILREAFAQGRAHDEGLTELDGRVLRRIRLDCLYPPCRGPRDYWYVDPETFLPVQFEAPHSYGIGPPGGGATLWFDMEGRYLTYEYLPRTAANLALTDIRAQHPDATVRAQQPDATGP
jgi:hypothetical protein